MSKSKLEVEFIYGSHPFSKVLIKAQNDCSPVGRTMSCNAVQLRHFLVQFVIVVVSSAVSISAVDCVEGF